MTFMRVASIALSRVGGCTLNRVGATVVASGFATRAFLVALRLLIKDFFWMAISDSSQVLDLFHRSFN